MVAPRANGATAWVDPNFGRDLVYSAAAGEANRVEASYAPDGTITVYDAGAEIEAGSGCVSIDAHTVECSDIDSGATYFLGDEDDVFDVLEGHAVVFAETGADVLTACGSCAGSFDGGDGPDQLTGFGELSGGPGDDTLTGSPRKDGLAGGPGNDLLVAGAGNDGLFPGGGDDVVDGGLGRDTVFYWDTGSVNANLGAGIATGAGTDALANLENLVGSEFGDVLIGDGNRNKISGLSGPDVIVGRGGPDRLNGGAQDRTGRGASDRIYGGSGDDIVTGENGHDFLDGGSGLDRMTAGRGDDTIRARDGERDVVNGGPGRDRARVDRLDHSWAVERLLIG